MILCHVVSMIIIIYSHLSINILLYILIGVLNMLLIAIKLTVSPLAIVIKFT